MLVDDHRLFLDGMRHILRQLGKVDLLAFDSVSAALREIDRDTHFDLLILDLSLPEMGGLTMMQSLEQRGVIIPTVIVSSASDVTTIRRALEMGASGYIHKNASSQDMIQALQRVLQGEVVLPESLSSQLEWVVQSHGAKKTTFVPEQTAISERQIEVLNLVDQGLSNKQIAKVLAISEATVKYHVGLIFKNLGAKNRTSCLLIARQQGLLN